MHLRDMITRCARNYPSKTAFICGDRSRTWREMNQRSDRFGVALQGLGHSAGQTVGILSQEGIEVYEHFFACMKIAAPRVGLNTQYVWSNILHVLKDSDVRFLLIDSRCKHLVAERIAELEALRITLIGYGHDHGLKLDYERLLADAQGVPRFPNLSDSDTLFISYTSGTTGVPKGVMLTQVGAVNCIVHSLSAFGFGPDDVLYVPGASAWVVVMLYIVGLGNAMTIVIPDGMFQLQDYLRGIARYRVTIAFLVPTMLQRALLEISANPDKYDLSTLRMMMYGSAPSTLRLIREARQRLGVRLMQIYGLTEATSGWISFLTDADHIQALEKEPELLKSVGRIGIHYDCEIRDPSGQPVSPGQSGEVWLRGNTLMSGYINQPQATGEALVDGWLRTNDLGRLDERGYLYLMDRQKFLIITGAVNVFPSSVEAILIEHPALAEVAVVGIPHPEWGEAVVAAAVRSSAALDVRAQAIIEFCRGKLSGPETPKHVVFVDELPKTSNGKVMKAELKKWLSSGAIAMPWTIDEQ